MNLDDSNSLEHNKDTKSKDNLFSSFVKELQNIIENFVKNSPTLASNSLLEGSIYVVRDINDEKLSLVNVDTAEDIDIYVAHSKDKIDELQSKGILKNIYEISKDNLYNLNLGSNITIKNGKCVPYEGEVKIINSEAAAKLEDMYFCLEQEKDAEYLISKISDDKIYLTNTKEGGYFSIPKEAYPDFKVGNLVKNINGKYILI